MPSTPYIFPFGEPVRIVAQRVKEPKRVFVLGTYGRAVHADWIGFDGQVHIQAMAVASEPYIFWHGQSADHIIQHIKIPPEAGKLVPSASQYNGAFGRALDESYLKPLGLIRPDAWVCDLVPYFCQNSRQKERFEVAFQPLAESHNLAPAQTPPVPGIFADEQRQQEILAEILHADPEIIILLGDHPVKWFLNAFDDRWHSLADFGYGEHYGKLHTVELNEKRYSVLPLVRPNQAAGLGLYSRLLADIHKHWVKEKAAGLLKKRFYY